MSLLFPFCLALMMACFGSAFLPVNLVPFAPFLAIVYQKKRLIPSLWIAFGCGAIMDILASSSFFTLNFLVTTLFLHRQKRHFFEDSALTLPLYTLLISSLSTLLHFIFLAFADKNPPFSWALFCTDVLVMPLFDALYAAIWFIGPMKFYSYLKKHGLKSFFIKEET